MRKPVQFPFEPADPLEGVLYGGDAADAPLLILAHGAGAGQHSRFIGQFAEALARRGVRVLTFDFPYMHARRRVPDRPPVLEAAWRAVLAGVASKGLLGAGACVVGGKSMGGRIVSQVLAANAPVATTVQGLVLLGYPLHPPGRPAQLRSAHLPNLRVPVLIVQGERDTFGTPDEVRKAFAVTPGPVELHVIPGGDHSFTVSRSTTRQAAVNAQIHETIAAWIARLEQDQLHNRSHERS